MKKIEDLKKEIKNLLKNTRKCVICDKLIPIKKRQIGYAGSRTTETSSDFGIYFHPYHVWFCNDCAKEVYKK